MSIDASTSTTGYAHIVRTPGFMGGEPCIDGQRIRVRDVAAARDLGGYSPEEIASTVYPHLTLGQIYAALAYYEDHRDEIDQARHEEAKFVEEFIKSHPQLIRDVRPKTD